MIEYKCRNMTMEAFAAGLRGLLGANVGVNPVIDQTGITGMWNFDLKYSIGLISLTGAGGEQLTIFEAIDKQLGLKLEERQIPTEVVAVASVNRTPIENPPGTAEAIPQNAIPTEFEVATIKPTAPGSTRSMFSMQPGGRLVSENMPLSTLILRAFNSTYSGQVTDIPTWANTARFDLMAITSTEGSPAALDPDTLAPLLLALLKERFGLKYHVEQREQPAYDLVADKPKMTKADPASRAWCRNPAQVPGAAPAPQGSQVMICQNITMSQFADLLRGRVPGLETPPLDLTELEGGWDFRLTYDLRASLQIGLPAARAPEGAAPSPLTAAPDPIITGPSLFDALEKQLGLKLEKTKRMAAVTIIDSINQTPSDN
jgi:uncharacterized protein (TIGR03435 family)